MKKHMKRKISDEIRKRGFEFERSQGDRQIATN